MFLSVSKGFLLNLHVLYSPLVIYTFSELLEPYFSISIPHSFGSGNEMKSNEMMGRIPTHKLWICFAASF